MIGRSLSIIILLTVSIISLFIIFKGTEPPTVKPHTAITPQKNHPVAKPKTIVKRPIPLQKITGVSYQTTIGDTLQISLDAKSITLRKKKFGFFRFKLLSEAVIRNGLLQLYANPTFSQASKTGNKPPDRELAKNLLGSILPANKAVTIKIMPAAIIIHHADGSVTKISSQLATINPGKNEIIFKHNAIAVSDNRKISANQLTLLPVSGRIKASRNIKYSGTKSVNPQDILLTDLFLNPVSN